jgi:hypothetical protein
MWAERHALPSLIFTATLMEHCLDSIIEALQGLDHLQDLAQSLEPKLHWVSLVLSSP